MGIPGCFALEALDLRLDLVHVLSVLLGSGGGAEQKKWQKTDGGEIATGNMARRERNQNLYRRERRAEQRAQSKARKQGCFANHKSSRSGKILRERNAGARGGSQRLASVVDSC